MRGIFIPKRSKRVCSVAVKALSYNRNQMKAYFKGLKNRIAEFYPGNEEADHVPKPDFIQTVKSETLGEIDFIDPIIIINPRERYKHPCWCQPRLMYEDEEDNCQLWLHNRVQ